MTALHMAAEKGSVECLSLLLKHPSMKDVFVRDKVSVCIAVTTPAFVFLGACLKA